MEPPLEQYEIVEVGQENHQPRQRAATAYPKQHDHPHPGRGPRRQTDPGNGAFPYPSGGFSEPTLPSHTTTRSPRERPLSEAPEDDYENMLDETGKKKKFHKPPAVPEPSNSDSDLDDYENTGPKGSLIPHDRKGRQQGHDNRGVDLDEEPQELYGNQDVINECKEDEGPLPDYVDMSGAPPPQRPVNEDDDQPVYGNEVEHPYQNVHFP
nr:hypothetical protein BaRGS_026963 [Batillaria attramentaria]